jgi:hypothetical protein
MTKSLSPSQSRKLVNNLSGKSNQAKGKRLESAVKELLELHNCEYHRVDNYRCFKCGQVQNSNAKGFPDFFVYYPFLLAIECKTGKGRLSKAQKKVKRLMEDSGIPFLVVRDTTDKLIEYLEGKL